MPTLAELLQQIEGGQRSEFGERAMQITKVGAEDIRSLREAEIALQKEEEARKREIGQAGRRGTGSRYFTKFTKLDRYFNKKDLILNNLEKNNIITIDLTTFFDQEDDLKQYFPLGYVGHYNKKGYKKISNILINKINELEWK